MTAVASSQRALDADQMQFTLQSGPSVDAVLNNQSSHPADLAADPRWPQFGPRVSAELGFNSCLSYPLAPDLIINATTPATATLAPAATLAAHEISLHAAPVANGQLRPFMSSTTLVGHRSSLNVYGDDAGTFGQDALIAGLLFATYAVSLITTASAQDTIHHLEQALVNARQIGVAVGIVMNAQKLTQDVAFNMLRIASQNSNRKISDLAVEVALTGALPVHTVRRSRGK